MNYQKAKGSSGLAARIGSGAGGQHQQLIKGVALSAVEEVPEPRFPDIILVGISACMHGYYDTQHACTHGYYDTIYIYNVASSPH